MRVNSFLKICLPKKPQINWLIKEQTLEHKEKYVIYRTDAFANESIEKLKKLLNS
jgi:hypothetical protein